MLGGLEKFLLSRSEAIGVRLESRVDVAGSGIVVKEEVKEEGEEEGGGAGGSG